MLTSRVQLSSWPQMARPHWLQNVGTPAVVGCLPGPGVPVRPPAQGACGGRAGRGGGCSSAGRAGGAPAWRRWRGRAGAGGGGGDVWVQDRGVLREPEERKV